MNTVSKLGTQALFTSTRNSVEGNLALFEKTHCSTCLNPINAKSPLMKACLDKRPMRTLDVPEPEEWLRDDELPHYPYEKSFAEACAEPFVVLHTSGSTGLPKPITVPHGALAVHDAYQRIPRSADSELILHQFVGVSIRIFLGMPLFHAAGIFLLSAFPIYYGIVPVMPPPNRPMSADLANSIHVHGNLQASLVAPSVLEDISQTPSYLKNLRNMMAFFGGGPLPKAAGDVIRGQTKLLSCYGSTEAMLLPTQMVDQEDWEYTSLSPYAGAEFRQHSEDLYELVLVRQKDLELYQGIFRTFPDLQEYSMHDLYSKHPTKPDLWRYRGRSDDVIVLVNGEKLNPVTMEEVIGSHPEVRAALVVGQTRFQTALLIEPLKPDLSEEHKGKLVESVWPVIERANSEYPAHARLTKSLLLFTTSAKPMSRAGKGTIQRATTLQQYAKEIDALYTGSDPNEESLDLDTKDFPSMSSSIRYVIEHSTKLESLGDEDDFFTHGMDSLQVLQVVRRLRTSLSKNGIDVNITTSTIYMHPTVAELSKAILQLVHPSLTNGAMPEEDDILKMQESLEKWSSDLPDQNKDSSLTVVLTGSTGSLGSYLLDALLAEPKVTKVYCLNRSNDAGQRQLKSNSSRGLTTSWNPERVSFLQTDMSKPLFGLSEPIYNELLQQVTHIIHNAWAVDFNLALSSFEDTHIRGVRQFIDFSVHSKSRAQIFFTSSISTLMNWNANHSGAVPEHVFDDFTVAAPMGYAESKHISERLLAIAGKVSNVPSAVCRVGQVTGPIGSEKGMWNKQEWFPSIVASSAYLGLLPDSLMAMGTEWIPVDVLAKVIVELLNPADSGSTITRVYHTLNPHSAEWRHLFPAVKEGLGGNIKVVPYHQWVDALERSATKTEDVGRNPAIKLLDFFKGLEQQAGKSLQLETKETVKSSKTLAGLRPVSPEWISIWMKQWGF